MALEIIHDQEKGYATFADNTTMWAVGPLFTGADAELEANEFLDWFASGEALEHARSIGVNQHPLSGGGTDPRDYLPNDLGKLYQEWIALVGKAQIEKARP